jgi:ribosome-associated heat shock protein Hsp15
LDRQRLDKWLWHARVVKARTSAAALVEAGHVRINGVREKSPGHAVKGGDVLTVGLDRTVRVLKVTGFSERRGDAASARVLYEDLQKPDLQKPDLQEFGLQESGSKKSGLEKPRE